MLVPEINLTPQLEARIARALGGPGGALWRPSAQRPVRRRAPAGLGPRIARRGAHCAGHAHGGAGVAAERTGADRSRRGTRPFLQTAGRAALFRARPGGVARHAAATFPWCSGSATPSLETWQHAVRGRYRSLTLPSWARSSALPTVRLVDMTRGSSRSTASSAAHCSRRSRLRHGARASSPCCS